MALQIWLPLTNDTHNQGIHDCAVTNYGATLVSTDGALGGCYKFNQENPSAGTKYMELEACMEDFLPDGGSFTMSVWYKMPSTYGPLHAAGALGFGLISTSDYQKSGLTIGVRTSGQLYIEAFTNGVSIDTPIVGANQAFDVWNHFCVTYNKDTKIATGYVNGATNSNWTVTINGWSNYAGRKVRIGRSRQGGWEDTFPGWLNDVRIYDHCLSAKEVKELSRGLIAHYKLDSHKIREAAPFPYMNGNGDYAGAGFWQDGTGGTHSINTDKNYIFNKDQARSLKISNASTTKPYLALVNSTQFNNAIASGGYRTFCAIIMDADGGVITGDRTICFPAYNARIAASGVPANYWTEIVPLGGGWYLCKQEGICQDGTDNMVGVFVQPGHSLYISEWHIENYATKMGNFGYYADGSVDIMEDSSGYGKNGTFTGYVVPFYSSGGGRYDASIRNLSGYTARAEVNVPPLEHISFSWFANYDDFGYQTSGLFSTSDNGTAPTDYTTTAAHMFDAEFALCNTAGTCYYMAGINPGNYDCLGKWKHYCLTYDGSAARFYINGVNIATKASMTGPLKGFKYLYLNYSKAGGTDRISKGCISDFRIYASTLSVDDIKDIMCKPASIDNKHGFETYEIKETENSNIIPENYNREIVTESGWWVPVWANYYNTLEGTHVFYAYSGWKSFSWITSAYNGQAICVDFDYEFTDLSNMASNGYVNLGPSASAAYIRADVGKSLDISETYVWKHFSCQITANTYLTLIIRGIDEGADFVKMKMKNFSVTKRPNGNIGASIRKNGMTLSPTFKEVSNTETYLYLPKGSYITTGVSYATGDTCTAITVIRYDGGTAGRDLMGYSATGAGYWGVDANGAWEPHGTFSYTNADITKINTIRYTYSGNESGLYRIGSLNGSYSTRGKYIYNVKLYKNGTLVGDFVPEGNGLRDIRNNTFYTPNGSSKAGIDDAPANVTKTFIGGIETDRFLEI